MRFACVHAWVLSLFFLGGLIASPAWADIWSDEECVKRRSEVDNLNCASLLADYLKARSPKALQERYQRQVDCKPSQFNQRSFSGHVLCEPFQQVEALFECKSYLVQRDYNLSGHKKKLKPDEEEKGGCKGQIEATR